MRIYLIGMPGSGKSSLGVKLANELNYKFADLDNLIEQKACMFIDEIFDAYGEKYFRTLESNVLKEYREDNVIISCGGGIIKDKNNKKYMDGLVIYLSVPLEILDERLKGTEDIRPLLKTKTVYQLYDERKDLYNYFKDIEIENVDMKLAISKIIEEIKND